MKTNLMWSALIAVAACADAGAPAGGPGAAAPGTEDGTIERLEGASEERPCGDRTVASVALPNGNRLALCVLESGSEVIHEGGPLGREAFFDLRARRPACGLELFLAGTGADVAVPAALVNACPPEHQAEGLAARTIVDAPVLQPLPVLTPTPWVNYCTVSDSTFVSQRCYECAPYDDCLDWCVSAHWGWHDRTMSFSNFLGEEGNIAIETNSSCGGTTRVRQWEREDAGDSWGTPDLDYNLGNGQWTSSGLIHHSAAVFGQDYDFRLRADSAAGAYHQHSGYFLDE